MWWLPAVAVMLAVAGCGDFGAVEQGIVVGSEGGELTLVLDSNPDGTPRYDRTPAVHVRIPADPDQMGPAPQSGGLIRLDTKNRRVILYSATEDRLLMVKFELLKDARNVYPDDARVARSGAPKVDRATGAVTLYAPRSRELVTIKAPEAVLALPLDAWRAGDVVRYYFKDPGQALRMMNVSQSKIG